MKSAAIYVRVSTQEQETDMQESELVEFAKRRGWRPQVFRDHGQSGAKENRPALDKMMTAVRHRKLDVVVVWALDRLARSLKQLLALTEEFQRVGVDFIAFKQNIDTGSAAGRLTYAVLGAVAEFEREMLRERVRAGVANARRNGKAIGRKPLRTFTEAERQQIRSELRRKRASVRGLAIRYGTTQFMISQILRGQEN
jgi:DNA invertase Pin-like site-specific DNA recombinase